MKMKSWTLLGFVSVFFGFASMVSAGELETGLNMQEQWGNVFGGKEAVFHVAVTSAKPVTGTVSWQFSCGGHTIARGEKAVEASPTNRPAVEVKFAVPSVKDGVIMPASLTVEFAEQKAEKIPANLVKQLYIFPENPFADRSDWLKKLNIILFDPAGKTAELFTKNEIPFKQVNTIGALSDCKDSLVIVGESVSFKESRGLADILVKTAASGIPVLCLAPSEGEIQMPGVEGSNQPFPLQITFRQNNIIAELDKRLDDKGWPPDGSMASNMMALQPDRKGILLAVANTGAGWPWVDLRFPAGKGRIILCSFKIVEKWTESPAPRFLLERILNDMTK